MLRTTTVSKLRAELATLIASLSEGPVMIFSHSKPAAVLVEPEFFENLIQRVELIEDVLDGRKVLAEYAEDSSAFLDAEDVFARLTN